MHVILKNQVSGDIEGAICINRETGSAIVLEGDIERLDELVRIAFAMKVPDVKLIIPSAAVEQLEAFGWQAAKDLVVMYRKKDTK